MSAVYGRQRFGYGGPRGGYPMRGPSLQQPAQPQYLAFQPRPQYHAPGRFPYGQATPQFQAQPLPFRNPAFQQPLLMAPYGQPYGGRPSPLGIKGGGKGDPHAAKQLAAAKAAARGLTAEDALDTLLAVLPKQGGTALPQVGSLIGTHRPGGWALNFAHLGSLSKFIEANPYYLRVEAVLPQPLVHRCDPDSLVDDGTPGAAPIDPEAPVVPYTAEEAIGVVYGFIPSGQAIAISQLGTSIGRGGWNANKQFSHLAKNLQTFLLDHPEYFAVDGTALTGLTVRHAGEGIVGTVTPAPRPQRPDGPRATPAEAAAAVLAVLSEAPLPLSQLGTLLGSGGWKVPYGYLGTLRSFLENNPELFVMEINAAQPGGQPMIRRGVRQLHEVAEVLPGQASKRQLPEDADVPPAKRVAFAVPVPVFSPVIARPLPGLPR